ncbi:MAG: 16S rRNA processing protein RimM [Mogibacterium sp.]|nr:16S rRNA processing protein RimM [Mogibacterium sp.]
MVNIGRFSGAVGLKGEVRVTLYAKDSENLHEESTLRVDGPSGEEVYRVLGIRYQKGRPVVRLDRVTTRDAAEALNGREVYIHEDDLVPLPEGEYYFRDLIGLRVVDRQSGEDIGVLEDIIENPAQNIYVVVRDNREVLIPAVDAFVKEIDPAQGVIWIELIEGML